MSKQHQLCFSESHIVIPQEYLKSLAFHAPKSRQRRKGSPLLGQTLQAAALISPQQIKIALEEQQKHPQFKLGEILSLHGWISQETADFFAQKWFKLLNSSTSYPIGYYLQQACLLSEQQVERILKEQKKMNLRFGELAVLDGFLKPQTRDFFLNHLMPNEIINPKDITKPEITEATIDIAHQIIESLPKHERELEVEDYLIPVIND